MTDRPYLLDNAWREGRDRLDAVEALLDPGSIALLDRLGIEPGWTCLELGAGGGSIAKWLSARVGATGHVVATDLDTRHLVSLAELLNVEVRRHDIVSSRWTMHHSISFTRAWFLSICRNVTPLYGSSFVA